MQLAPKLYCLVVCISLSLLARAQLVSITVNKQPLEKIFPLIEKQTNHSFVYSTEMMSQAKPVTATIKDQPLRTALEICFVDQPLGFVIDEKHVILYVKKKKAEPLRSFRGKVTDDRGEPLGGISLAVKGTTIGTVSENNGDFSLNEVPESFRLLVTGVQIEPKEVAVTNQNFIVIKTEPRINSLDQTIVIAYGTSKKKYLVESVSRVKGSDITKQPISNPVAALTGRVPGMLVTQLSGVPGAAVRVQIRGRNSLVNGNDPLYIVDGVPFPSTAFNESTAGGGVLQSPLDNIAPSAIESIEVLKDAGATAIYGSRGANGVILITTKKGTGQQTSVTINAYTGAGKITRPIDLFDTPDFLAMRREAFANDGITPTAANAPDLLVWDTTAYRDWQKELIGNTMTVTDVNASVSLGNANTRVLASTGYRRESTVFAGDFWAEKISGMFNVNHRGTDNKFTFSASVNFLQNKNILPREDLTSYIKTPPNAPPIYTPDGKLNWQNSTWINPYSMVLHTFSNRDETWQVNSQIGYMILPGLSVQVSGGITSIGHTDHAPNPISAQNPATAPIARATFGRRTIFTAILEPQVNYDWSPFANHHFSFLVGGSLQHSNNYFITQQGNGYSNEALMRSITAASAIQLMGETNTKYRYAAAFGRMQYDFSKKYLFTFSVRRDGSSRYSPENRFATFGSVGLGWILTSEKWMENFSWLNFAKLRASTGTTGNDQIGDYKFLDLYGPLTTPYQGLTPFSPTQLFSPNYGWENVRKLEGGIDLSFFKNRFSLTVNYYHNTTTNQLVNYTLPITTGFSGVLRNVDATVRNTGWEIDAGAEIVSNKNWRWTSSFNITFLDNKLVDFENFEKSTYANQYVLGQSTSILKTYKFTGIDKASGLYTFKDFNNDGRISAPDDLQNYVVMMIPMFGGWENTISYKSFSLSFHLAFSQQPAFSGYPRAFGKPGSIDNQPDWVINRWQKMGDNSEVQRYSVSAALPATAYSNFQQSDAAYTNASFIRLRNVQLAYTWRFARIYITGQNLAVWTNYQGLDPETGTILPPLKMLIGGIQLNF